MPVKEPTCQREGGQAGKEQASFFYVLFIGCQKKVWPGLKVALPTSEIWVKGISSNFTRFELNVGLPTSNDLRKKSLTCVPSHLGFSQF